MEGTRMGGEMMESKQILWRLCELIPTHQTLYSWELSSKQWEGRGSIEDGPGGGEGPSKECI